MRFLRSISRGLDLLSESGTLKYLASCRAPSIASYRMCRALRSLVGAPNTIVDVGANQGQFACASAWWFPAAEIISFEPSPSVFRRLERNTSRLGNVQRVNSALGASEGEIEFFENQYSHASSVLRTTEMLRSLRSEIGQVNRIQVKITTLDRFFQSTLPRQPILLKLDVQGFERKVLEGATKFLEAVDYLVFECSYREMYVGEPLFTEMFEFVTSLGFDIVAPLGYLEDEHHVMLQTDLLWSRRRRS